MLVANSTLEESMGVVPELHSSMRGTFSSLLTVIAPKDISHAKQVHAKLQAQGLTPTLWSHVSQVTLCTCFASVKNCSKCN